MAAKHSFLAGAKSLQTLLPSLYLTLHSRLFIGLSSRRQAARSSLGANFLTRGGVDFAEITSAAVLLCEDVIFSGIGFRAGEFQGFPATTMTGWKPIPRREFLVT